MESVGARRKQTKQTGGAGLQGPRMRCTYNGCEHPTEGSHFVEIEGDSDAEGQDWSNLAGSVLCEACYFWFRQHGTLERGDHCRRNIGGEKWCTYAGCERPTESSRFRRINGESTAGGQDWSGLAGSVLCEACYSRFKDRGTLERGNPGRPLEVSERRCTYAGCERPTESSCFRRINGESTAGGQDWSGLAGSVLCEACYSRFKHRGTLERGNCGRPLEVSERRCTYTGCKRPTESSYFKRIDGESTSGGQDWSGLAGSVLCKTCYSRFYNRGTLKRGNPGRPPVERERRCTYAGCERPTESRDFYRIDGESTAGGQDWSGLAGGVLCNACYQRFQRRGTLERSDRGRPPAESERRCKSAHSGEDDGQGGDTDVGLGFDDRPDDDEDDAMDGVEGGTIHEDEATAEAAEPHPPPGRENGGGSSGPQRKLRERQVAEVHVRATREEEARRPAEESERGERERGRLARVQVAGGKRQRVELSEDVAKKQSMQEELEGVKKARKDPNEEAQRRVEVQKEGIQQEVKELEGRMAAWRQKKGVLKEKEARRKEERRACDGRREQLERALKELREKEGELEERRAELKEEEKALKAEKVELKLAAKRLKGREEEVSKGC